MANDVIPLINYSKEHNAFSSKRSQNQVMDTTIEPTEPDGDKRIVNTKASAMMSQNSAVTVNIHNTSPPRAITCIHGHKPSRDAMPGNHYCQRGDNALSQLRWMNPSTNSLSRPRGLRWRAVGDGWGIVDTARTFRIAQCHAGTRKAPVVPWSGNVAEGKADFARLPTPPAPAWTIWRPTVVVQQDARPGPCE